jgi:hypothetical protein
MTTNNDSTDDPAAVARRYQAALNALRDSDRRIHEAHRNYGSVYYRTQRFVTLAYVLLNTVR